MKKLKDTKRKKKKRGTPDWALMPFECFIKETDRLFHVVRLSARGISMLRATPKIIEALMKAEGESSQSKVEQLDDARKETELAQREVESGFPILHSWAIVGLWAQLESLIRVFITSWLKRKRSSWRIEPIARLRIKLGEYESIPKDRRHAFVADLLEREIGAGLRSGVTRFESLLEPFGLSGDLPEILRRTIYEFGQVRNVIAHSGNKVDRHFVGACPWLNAKVGTNIHVSAEMFKRYYFAAGAYITFIICRIGEKYGVDMSETRTSIEEEVNRILSNKSIKVIK